MNNDFEVEKLASLTEKIWDYAANIIPDIFNKFSEEISLFSENDAVVSAIIAKTLPIYFEAIINNMLSGIVSEYDMKLIDMNSYALIKFMNMSN